LRTPLAFLLVCLLSALFPRMVRADHFSGASITYECNGGNMYTIYLDLYLDCAGTAITPQTLQFSNSCGTVFSLNNLQPTLVEEVSPLCDNSLANSTCNGGALPGFRHYRFSSTLFLASCNYWTISWSICCRNTMQNVVGVPGIYVEATLNNAGGVCDNSPAFTDTGVPYTCVGNDLLYSPGATDADGNTLVFTLINARFLQPPPVSVNYQPGYTGAAPMPGMTIDPSTGQLTFSPNVSGNYVVVIQISSYDAAGNLIGTVMRDLMFVAVPCTGVAPTTNGVSNAQGAAITASNAIEVCDGVPFCVDLVFDDPDPTNAISMVSDATQLLPGATFTVTGTAPATGTLCWTPDASILPLSVFIEVTDGQCPIENSTSTSILISATQLPPVPPDAGTDGTTSVCPTSPSFALLPLLGGTPDAGGTWTAPDGSAHSGTFDPAVDAFGDYTYTVNAGCLSASTIVTVDTAPGASAGTDAMINVCSNGAPTNLFNALGGTPTAGGTWSGPNGAMNGTYDPTTMVGGPYTYTITNGPCPGASATVTVMETPAAIAGTDNTVTLCSTSAQTDLFPLLGAGVTPGGTWTGPSNINGFYNPFQHNPGIYTYTVTGTAPCTNSSATITVVENQAVNAGTNGNLLVCSNGAPIDLMNALNGTPQPGGTWAGPDGPMNGIYDPAIHPDGFYSYTVTAALPCADATSFVTVTLSTAADAGTNGTITLCSDGAAVDLMTSLGGTPQAGGTWTGPSAINGTFDPVAHLPGLYTYTVAGTYPCANATATVDVAVNTAVSAGTDASLQVCSNDAPIDLFAQLGPNAQAGGTWSGPGATNGTFTPGIDPAGDYIYTITAVAPCNNSTATVTINVSTAPDAGTLGNIDLCSDMAPVDLMTALGGTPQPGGTWSGPSAINGTFDPSMHQGGVYIYTITGTAPCVDASASVIVTLSTAVDAGTDASVDVCASDAPIDLLVALGPAAQAGGTWSGPSAITGSYDPALHAPGTYTYTLTGSGVCADASASVVVNEQAPGDAGGDALIELCTNDPPVDLLTILNGTPQSGGTWTGPSAINGIFDPAVHNAGDYQYTISGNGICPDAMATVTVTVQQVPDSGTDGNISLCSSDPAVDLFTVLGGTPEPGGTWSGPSNITGNYDPLLHLPGDYVYSITGNGNCPGSSATVIVTESPAVDAGLDGTLELCSVQGVIDLFTALGGTPAPGGTWSGPSNTNGLFDPAIHAGGIYTYSVAGTAPCPSDNATVAVAVETIGDAGVDASITVCDAGGAVDLFVALGGGAQPGGNWSGPSVTTGSYDPALHQPGVYTYTLAGGNICPASSATVTVTESGSPNAGTDAVLDVCADDQAIDLITLLGGADPGGTWSGPVAFTGIFDPSIHPDGVYTYSIAAVAPCLPDDATVNISVSPSPDAGTNGDMVICATSGPTNLFDGLGGSPQPGGTWAGPAGVSSGMYDPAIDAPGVFTYTVQGSGSCGSATATVTVTETDAPDAGDDGSISVCSSEAPFDLVSSLGGAPDAGGTWSGPAGNFSGTFDPASHPGGVYTYTIDAPAPCVADQATVTVTLEAAANAGTDASIDVCSSSAPVDLFLALGAGAGTGGTWNGPDGNSTGTFDPSTGTPGIYTYTIAGNICPSASATVTVNVQQGPDAGENASIDICSMDGTIDLTAQLGGTPDAGGTWQDGNGNIVPNSLDPATATSDTYVYTVGGTGACPEAASTLEITISPAPQAGISGVLQLCDNAGQGSLFDGLTGTLDAGGVWTAPDGSVHSTVVDPLLDASGTYTYTVTSGTCPPATSTVNVVIFAAPDAGENASTTLCTSDDPIPLITLLGGAPDVTGTWTGPDGSLASTFTPGNSQPGTYTYTVTGNAACATDQAMVIIAVNPAANAGTDGSVTLCSNDPAVDLFTLLGGTPQNTGTWTAPDGSAFNGNFNPAIHNGGIYTYTVQPASPCAPASATVNVNLLPLPAPNITATNSDACAPVEVTVSHDFEGSATCTWLIGNGTFSEECGPFTTSFEEPGTYSVTLIIDAGNGCGSNTITLPDLINVYVKPEAAFMATPEVVGTASPEVYFHNQSIGANSYLWDMGGSGTYDSEHVNHTFPAQLGDEYEVCLIAFASPQCADTICKTITVGDALLVHVPNAFSPDGDGINDEFMPVLDGIDPETYTFEIYDRWGQVIFATRTPGSGWNGNFTSGEEVPLGVYVWKMHVTDPFTGRRKESTGSVTLVR
jgi:gliding motility-associated-like protein